MPGRINVITGHMGSGKTSYLLDRIRKVHEHDKGYIVFKHSADTRVKDAVETRDGIYIKATTIPHSREILEFIETIDIGTNTVIMIDEAQFFDSGLIDICIGLARDGYQIFISGLNLDYRGKPFGPMPGLMAVADDVLVICGKCAQCDNDAIFSQRLTDEKSIIHIDDSAYEPRCRDCFTGWMV